MVKTTERNRFRVSILAAAISLCASGAYAAGLGAITVLSPLGQPLRAEIDVSASRDELASLSARLASPEAFKQVGIDYAPGVSGIRFAVDKRKDGQPFLRVTSDRPINEPFLDVLVELTWASGRMVREYTVLLDPPEALAQGGSSPVAKPEVPRTAAAPAPVTPPAPPVEAAPPPPAPVAAPAPAAVAKAPAAEPAPAPVEKTEAVGSRTVQRGDTLSKIAAETKPEGVTLDQMLVALFRGNQDAFDAGNMNRLRSGKILNVPDASAVAAVAPSEARQVVVAQARDFNAYRSRLAASVAATPAKEEQAKQLAQGRIGAKVAEKAAPETSQDKLAVSRTETPKDAKAIQGRIAALEEDLVARDKAIKEANSRVAELERNLSDLKKLAELKSQTAAQVQQQAEAAKAQAEAKKPVEAPAKPVEPVKAAEPPKAVEPPPPPAVVESPPAKPVEVPPVAKAPVPPAPAPVQEEQPGFLEENPLLLYGGGGLIALLLGYLGFSSWKRKGQGGATNTSTASRLSEGDLMANSVFGTTGGQAVDTSASIQTDFSQASLSAIDTDEGVDPVAEADVYMAYGRDAQAEEILLDALKTDPTRVAIHLKLLEIYAGHKNLSQFEHIANGLREQTSGSGPDWEKAAAMGRALDPGNPLYAGSAPVTEPQPELVLPVAKGEAPAAAPVAAAADTGRMGDTVTLPGQLARLAAAAGGAAGATATSLGFDLGVPALDAAHAPEPVADMKNVDLNLDLGTETVTAAAAKPMDIDLSLPEVGTEVPLEAPAPDLSASALDFEFDLDAPPTPASAATSFEAVPAAGAVAMDFSGINLDLVTSTPAAEPATHAQSLTAAAVTEVPVGDGFSSFEGGVETTDVDSHESEVATKLELAQAYEEMGDREGARELLQEVLQEGSSQQQDAARARLATLDV